MTKTKPSILLRSALTSNASDAAGNQLYDTIISIIVVTSLGFSATQLGLLNALGSLSFLLLVVPIGIVVDSWGASRIIVFSLAAKLVLAATTLALLATDTLTAPATFVIVTLLGVTTVASENAQTAIVPRISSGKQEVTSFISSMAAADRIAGIVAPGLAGALAAISGGSIALTLSVASFAVAGVAALRLLTVPRAEGAVTNEPDGGSDGTAKQKPALRTQLLYGFAILKRNRFLLGTTLLVAAGNIGLALGDSLEPILVLRELELGKLFYGLLGTIAAVSGIGATFVAARVTSRFTMKRIFFVGALAQASIATLPLLSLLVPQIAYVTMSLFSALWAITLTITNIAGAAYAAQAVSAESLGRAAAARRMITMGSVPVAALGSGALADIAGLAVPLVIWPVLTFAAALVFFAMTSGHEEHPGEHASASEAPKGP